MDRAGARRLRTLACLLPAVTLGACATVAPPPAPAPVAAPASVRVAFDRDRIGAVAAHGLADRETGRRVTERDPVRIASISKLVTAIGLMRLVEAGTLDLDADVSGLLGYRLRHPRYPDVPVTLRLLLSHRSGLRDDAGYIVPLGTRLADRLADPRAWDADHAPGAFYRYTNLNFPVVAAVMERATGKRFDRLMQRLVLAPLKLDACFNWASCPDATAAHAVVLYGADGTAQTDDLHGRRPACPVVAGPGGACDLSQWRPGDNGALFSPQGGLRISMHDLATIGRLLARGGEVDGVRLLTPASVAMLRGPEWRYDGRNGDTGDGFDCRYGLAMQTLATPQAGCRDDLFGDGVARFGHAGDAYGLRSGLWIDPATGRGVAFFVTAVPEGARSTRSAFSLQEEMMARGRR